MSRNSEFIVKLSPPKVTEGGRWSICDHCGVNSCPLFRLAVPLKSEQLVIIECENFIRR